MSRQLSFQEKTYLTNFQTRHDIYPGQKCGKCKNGLCGVCFWNRISISPDSAGICSVHDYVYRHLKNEADKNGSNTIIKYKLKNNTTKKKCGKSCIWHDYFFDLLDLEYTQKYGIVFEEDRSDEEKS